MTDISCSTKYKILTVCLQTSDLKSVPHEISGEISISGAIESMACSCKADLGSACKHIVAVLLHCNRWVSLMRLQKLQLLLSVF